MKHKHICVSSTVFRPRKGKRQLKSLLIVELGLYAAHGQYKQAWCLVRLQYFHSTKAINTNRVFGTDFCESLRQNIHSNLFSQQTPDISPSRASYGVSIVRKLEKIDRVITALHCIAYITSVTATEYTAIFPQHQND